MPKDLTVRFYEYGPAPGISFHGISHDDVHVECGLDSIYRWIGRHRLMHFDGDFEGAMEAELTIRARIEELALDLTEMGVPLERSLAWLEVFRRNESARMLIEFEAAEEGTTWQCTSRSASRCYGEVNAGLDECLVA
ncbi:hypothetical protein GGE65_007075 [Skermanella aerolata]|uniref:hypothetical protein n=1 Tax=Skermanella aerolata TaxID=393310 RepID=UPI003D19BA2B